MRSSQFVDRAARLFDEIPPEFRAGVDGLVVEPEAARHPSLPGIWTLGECITDDWPDGTGGIGDSRSRIVLYFGSFQELADDDPMFDWEAELWETIMHELLHHREAAAAESGLDVFDWAVDQNFLVTRVDRSTPISTGRYQPMTTAPYGSRERRSSRRFSGRVTGQPTSPGADTHTLCAFLPRSTGRSSG